MPYIVTETDRRAGRLLQLFKDGAAAAVRRGGDGGADGGGRA